MNNSNLNSQPTPEITRVAYRLVAHDKKLFTDLTLYTDMIIETVNNIAPGHNPVVYEDCYVVDQLTHKEAVDIGMALSAIEKMGRFCQTVTQSRLFQGRKIKPENEKKKRIKMEKKEN